jgi:Zn finger protein HypA/HybF involved in hydrogenase expression
MHGKTRHCRHCGKLWIRRLAPIPEPEPEPEPPPVVQSADPGIVAYHVVRCPSCGSKNTKVSSTRRPLRHHKCKDCNHNFKSEEV